MSNLIRGHPVEQWERLEKLIVRLQDLAFATYGTRSYTSMGRLCGLTHETIRRYNERMVFPVKMEPLDKLAEPLKMSGVEALAYILGDDKGIKDPRIQAIAYVKGLDPTERMAFISEALAA